MLKTSTLLAAVAAAALLSAPLATPSFAKEKTVMVGGAPMYPSKNIIQNAVNSKDHTTLVAAVKAAGLVDTLRSRARSRCSRRPTRRSRSCRRAPSKRCSSPRTRTSSPKILTYHVVSGTLTTSDLKDMIKKGTARPSSDRRRRQLIVKMKAGKIIVIDDGKGDDARSRSPT